MAQSLGGRDGGWRRRTAPPLITRSAKRGNGRELQSDPPGAPGGAPRPLGGLQRGALTCVELRRFDAESQHASPENAVEDGATDPSQQPEGGRKEMIRTSGLAAAGLGAVFCVATVAAPAAAETPKRGGILTYIIPAHTPPRF